MKIDWSATPSGVWYANDGVIDQARVRPVKTRWTAEVRSALIAFSPYIERGSFDTLDEAKQFVQFLLGVRQHDK